MEQAAVAAGNNENNNNKKLTKNKKQERRKSAQRGKPATTSEHRKHTKRSRIRGQLRTSVPVDGGELQAQFVKSDRAVPSFVDCAGDGSDGRIAFLLFPDFSLVERVVRVAALLAVSFFLLLCLFVISHVGTDPRNRDSSC